MPVSLEQFVENLIQSGLMSADEVAAFQTELPAAEKTADAEALARALVKAGKLTKYQMKEVYQGHTEGLVLGEYVILDEIGAGGMGKVLKARHRRMKRIVALKIVSEKLVESPESLQRFQREVEAAARLIHPNIVTAFDAGESKGTHFLVMEYVRGQDLSHLIKDHGPLAVEQAVECIIQAARGLEYAHKHGVIHRDIKPANLLLDEEGTVKILDMGLARLEGRVAEGDAPTASVDADRLTSTGVAIGTCDYMAPEQAEDTHTADQRADIYALGCTLYRILTGKPPYTGNTNIQVLLAHREKPIPSLRDARPDVPEELDTAFQQIIAKRPVDRYQSMTTVIEALQSCVAPPSEKAAPDELSRDSALTSFLKQQRRGGPAVGTKPAAKAAAGPRETVSSSLKDATGTHVRSRLSQDLRKPRFLKFAAAGLLSFVGILAIALILSRPGQEAPKSTAPSLAIAPFDARQAKKHQQAWADYLGVPVEWTNSIGMKFVLIPPGEFMMGSTEEEVAQLTKEAKRDNALGLYAERLPAEAPQHQVRITKPFYLGACEVTVGQFRRFVSDDDYRTEGERDGKGGYGWDGKSLTQKPEYTWEHPGFPQNDDHPVTNVSWNDAEEFCKWLSRKQGKIYRLPTESQWEYACRAGTKTRYYSGNDAETVAQVGNVADASAKAKISDLSTIAANDGYVFTAPVGSFRPNAFGLYDTHGNVWKWCADWYDSGYYAKSPRDDPGGPATGSSRVGRGGSWCNHARRCRSANRSRNTPEHRYSLLGFRLACQIPTDPPGLAKFAAAEVGGRKSEVGTAKEEPEAESGKPEAAEEPPEYKPITIGPPAKPMPIEIKPEPIAIKPGQPLGPMALVTEPAPIRGLLSWSIVAIDPRHLVRSAMFSPNNQKLATISSDTIRIWDVEKHQLLQAIVGHDEPVLYGIWSPDGRFLASSSFDNSVRLWDAGSGRLVRTMRCPHSVFRLAWAPDGSALAAATYNPSKVCFWDLRDGTDHRVFDTGGDSFALAWSPDATMLATNGEHRSAALWNPRNHTLIRSLKNQGGGGLSWSPDGKLIASFGYWNETRPIRLWDVAAGQQLRELPPRGAITYSVAWSPDSKTLAVGETGSFSDSKPASVVLWREETGQPVWEHVLEGYYGRVDSLSFSADGNMLAVALDNGLTIACDTESGKTEFTLPANPFEIQQAIPSVDGMSWMTTCPETGISECWEMGRDAVPHLRRQLNEAGVPVALSLAAGLCATHDPVSGMTRVWDLTQDSKSVELATDKGVRWAAFAPDGTKLATASEKGKGQLWDIKSASFLHALPGTGNGLAWSPNGKLLAVGAGSDVLLCNPENPRETTFISGAEAALQKLTWSPDGKVLAAAAKNGRIYLWDCDSGKLFHELHGDYTWLSALGWLGKGERLVSSGGVRDSKSCVWDVASGKRLRAVDGNCYVCGDLDLEMDESGYRVRHVDGDLLCTVLVLCNGRYVSVSPDGHYRGSPEVEKELVYVVLTDSGEQLTLTPEEFSKKYGWKNDPAKVGSRKSEVGTAKGEKKGEKQKPFEQKEAKETK